MEYEVVKKWLDEKVELFLLATKEDYLTTNISARVSIDRQISIEKGLDVIADVMGLKIEERPYKYEGETFYFYTFVYRDVTFSTCQRERYKGYGTDRE